MTPEILAAGVALPKTISTGLVDGCVYGLLALGLVLVYKSSRVFNFAQAELGGVAAFITMSAYDGLGPFPKLPAGLAIALGLVSAVLTGLLIERLVIRPLFHAPRATLMVATAGAALAIALLQGVMRGTDISAILPNIGGGAHYAIFGSINSAASYIFGWDQIVTVLALVGAALGAVWFFRTRYGAAVLAVSQEPVAASAVGIDVARISALVWAIAGLLGGVAGIVYFAGAPYVPGSLSGFAVGASPLISAFTAAVLGGMTSLPGAFAGGLVIGVVQQLAGNYLPSSLPGGSVVVVCALLLVVLLVRPAGLFGKEA
ncbi:MAG: branched-chain amino acid ABC transporter permease [Mycobacteriales bacterium]